MKYDHAFDIGFSVITANTAEEVTAQEIRAALLRRVRDVTDEELHEAVGMPFDSYEIDD